MLYCTYDEYLTAGGTVPETAFGVLCSRASRMIDAATFGNSSIGRFQFIRSHESVFIQLAEKIFSPSSI